MREIGEFTTNNEKKHKPNPTPNKEEVFTKLEQKLIKTIDAFDVNGASDNVRVQFILGISKFLYGDANTADMNPELSSLASDERTVEILNEKANTTS